MIRIQPQLIHGGLMAIGEAGGAEEAEQGKCFVGQAGSLLRQELKGVSIDVDHISITNVFLLCPPANNAGVFFVSNKEVTKKQKEKSSIMKKPFLGKYLNKEYDNELLRLFIDIEKYRPRIVLSLGNIPLWALLNREGIVSERGKLFRRKIKFKGKEEFSMLVIPTYHPAYVLRGRTKRLPVFQQDLQFVKQYYDGYVKKGE